MFASGGGGAWGGLWGGGGRGETAGGGGGGRARNPLAPFFSALLNKKNTKAGAGETFLGDHRN